MSGYPAHHLAAPGIVFSERKKKAVTAVLPALVGSGKIPHAYLNVEIRVVNLISGGNRLAVRLGPVFHDHHLDLHESDLARRAGGSGIETALVPYESFDKERVKRMRSGSLVDHRIKTAGIILFVIRRRPKDARHHGQSRAYKAHNRDKADCAIHAETAKHSRQFHFFFLSSLFISG